MDAPQWYDIAKQMAVPGVSGLEGRILDAGRRCYLQYGASKLSMADVGRVAGVSRGSVYKYYPHREALLDHIVEFAISTFIGELDEAMSLAPTLQDQAAAAAIVMKRWAASAQTTYGNVLGSQFELSQWTTRSGPTMDKIMTLIRRYVAQARGRGEVRADVHLGYAAEAITRVLMSLITNPAQTFDDTDSGELQEFVRAFVVQGLV
jgi:AcrR family transcriptional regulator